MSLRFLAGKRILLGISGGIAAYKCCELTREFKKAGADVRIVMTSAAQSFVTPLSLQALSGNEPHTELLNPEAEAGMGHIELARWADLMIIAPASADTISRLAHGEGGDLLTTVVLALRCELMIAPAMNEAMWHHAATQENLETLRGRGITLIGPASGEQACGDVGAGRMSEPCDIAQACASYFSTGSLAGKRVIITAGPTREAIDPVRYISNHSSGKMGYAMAQACQEAGALVTLVSGPTCLSPPQGIDCIKITSAEQMLAACEHAKPEHHDILIATAAVADYRPALVAEQKLKKQQDDLSSIELVENPDILATLSKKYPTLKCVGFAAETQHLEQNARGKLRRKNLALVIANDVSKSAIGFNSDTNAVSVFSETNDWSFSTTPKSQLARELVALIASELA